MTNGTSPTPSHKVIGSTFSLLIYLSSFRVAVPFFRRGCLLVYSATLSRRRDLPPSDRKGKQPSVRIHRIGYDRINPYLQALLTKSDIELKLNQCKIQYVQSRRSPPAQRTKQISALAVREKHQMQFTHSRAEPRPPGNALRKRSKMASGPRSLAMRWLNRKVANDPKTRTNQRTWNQNHPG